jgi:hypothetical protein
MEVAGMEDGMAVGRYLRVKVRKCINTPLMRGTMVEVDEKGKMLWCPFEYEYLPDFCFICGIIGHVDKDCSKKLKRGKDPQFGKWLRWVPLKKKHSFDGPRKWGDKGGRGSFSYGSRGTSLGSDAPSWRKETLLPTILFVGDDGGTKGGSNPLKLTLEDGGEKSNLGKAKKQLILGDVVQQKGSALVDVEVQGSLEKGDVSGEPTKYTEVQGGGSGEGDKEKREGCGGL